MTASTEIPVGGSPETQAIIDACFQENWSAIQPLVAARSEAAKQALESFLGQARDQGEDFTKAHEASLKTVEGAFGMYQESLKLVLQATQNKNAEQAKQAGAMLAVSSFSIRGAVVGLEEAYLSYGDSRFPVVNLFTNLGSKVRGGEVPLEAWQHTCDRYGAQYQGAIEEIDKSEEKDKPGIPERRAAIVRLVDTFKELRALTPGDHRDKYDNLMFQMTGCLAEMSEAIETYHNHTFLTGECKSPRINLVIKVARGVVEKRYDKAVLRSLATDLSNELQGYLKELDRMAKNPQESEVLNDSLADMIDVMESLDDGLQSLIAIANGEEVDPAEIQESLAILVESGDVLNDVNQTVAKYNETHSTVVCSGCGSRQQAGLLQCPACGTGLPQLTPTAGSSVEMMEGGEADYDEPVMTTVMQELFDKVEAFDGGRLDGDAFLDVLDAFDERIDLSEQKLGQVQSPEMPDGLDPEQRAISGEFITIAEDALSLLDVALAECREGIEHLRHFAETDEKESKQAGMQLYYDGTQKMWMVARAQKRVEEFIEASAKELGIDPSSARRGPGPSAPTSLSSRFSDHM